MKSYIINRTILDIDSPTRQQIHRALEEKRKQDRLKKTTPNSLLILPRNFSKIVDCCGQAKYRDELTEYFGDMYCKKCVEKWKAGEA